MRKEPPRHTSRGQRTPPHGGEHVPARVPRPAVVFGPFLLVPLVATQHPDRGMLQRQHAAARRALGRRLHQPALRGLELPGDAHRAPGQIDIAPSQPRAELGGSNRSRTAAGESLSPTGGVYREIASDVSCTWAGVSSSNTIPPKWGPWYRHIIMAMAAHAFLAVTAALDPKAHAGRVVSQSPRSAVSWR